jgi:IPT/TIG domain
MPGTPVTLTGMYFGASQGSATVTFNGTPATVTSWTNTQIVCTVPSGVQTGSLVTVNGFQMNIVPLTVTIGGRASNTEYFGIILAAQINATGLFQNLRF